MVFLGFAQKYTIPKIGKILFIK